MRLGNIDQFLGQIRFKLRSKIEVKQRKNGASGRLSETKLENRAQMRYIYKSLCTLLYLKKRAKEKGRRRNFFHTIDIINSTCFLFYFGCFVCHVLTLY